jgi:ABC-type branched-subunit amino acid transport system ATPase component
LKVADWAYLLETGRIVESGPAPEILAKESVKAVFLGGHASESEYHSASS